MRRSTALIVMLVFAVFGTALAIGIPDFSGTWTLNLDKSDMGYGGPMAHNPKMKKVTIVMKQTPSVLTITRFVGDRQETATEKLDGSESINKSPSGHDIKSNSKWAGSNLVTNSRMNMEGGGVVQSIFVRSLSPDGKTLMIETTLKSPNGGVKKQKLVYDKQ